MAAVDATTHVAAAKQVVKAVKGALAQVSAVTHGLNEAKKMISDR
jgi:hypothetical protein